MNATIREAVYFDRASLFGGSGVSRATAYRLERDGTLPKPVRLVRRIARWTLAETDDLERHAENRLAAVRYSSEGAY